VRDISVETEMVVYLDLVIMENMVMNYLILQLTARFSGIKASSLRIFIGALIGALYVVPLIMLPGIDFLFTASAKIILALVMIAVTFYPRKIVTFFKTLAIFFVSTFIFAGAGFALLYFNKSGGIVRNGVFVILGDSNWMQLVLAIVLVGIIVRIFWEMYQDRTPREKLLIPLKISFESRFINLAALVDTGNSLHDPLTNLPVIVVEFKAIKELLPLEIQRIFEEAKENDLGCVTNIISKSTWFSRFRLIPFTSLGKENGMLIGFKPDYIEIGESDEKKGVSDVIIGIYNRALSRNENYRALLGPELIT
jgi:stage II sporulation protein GA (sporulation sigma-E factor processing peptidase)